MSLDTKYRPRTLDKVIGQEAAVQRLRGIIETQNIPKTILFVGASSAGKTTLARAFTASLFGVKTLAGNPDYLELNSSSSRGIDDVRDMLRIAKLRPRNAIRRVILLDEAHGFTGPSADLLLKPLEEPPEQTLFILGTMEPEKLKQAMKNRASQFSLPTPSHADITKYVKRIVKGEELTYLTDDLIAKIVGNCNGEMRSAAALVQAVMQAAGKSKKMKPEMILEALSSSETADDALSVEVLACIYQRKLGKMYRHILDVQGGFQFITRLLGLNRFLIANTALGGARHKSVWWSDNNKAIHKIVAAIFKESGIEGEKALQVMSEVQMQLLELKRESGAFQIAETDAIGYRGALAIRVIKPYFKK